jgi:uncharacterized protein YjbJ (UPF0337 family)
MPRHLHKGTAIRPIFGEASAKLHFSRTKEKAVNKHQLKGTAKEVAGKVQQKAGKATGNRSQQAKGLARQVTGKAQKAFGNAQDNQDKAHRNRP